MSLLFNASGLCTSIFPRNKTFTVPEIYQILNPQGNSEFILNHYDIPNRRTRVWYIENGMLLGLHYNKNATLRSCFLDDYFVNGPALVVPL